jgi:hypothetical protein
LPKRRQTRTDAETDEVRQLDDPGKHKIEGHLNNDVAEGCEQLDSRVLFAREEDKRPCCETKGGMRRSRDYDPGRARDRRQLSSSTGTEVQEHERPPTDYPLDLRPDDGHRRGVQYRVQKVNVQELRR